MRPAEPASRVERLLELIGVKLGLCRHHAIGNRSDRARSAREGRLA